MGQFLAAQLDWTPSPYDDSEVLSNSLKNDQTFEFLTREIGIWTKELIDRIQENTFGKKQELVINGIQYDTLLNVRFKNYITFTSALDPQVLTLSENTNDFDYSQYEFFSIIRSKYSYDPASQKDVLSTAAEKNNMYLKVYYQLWEDNTRRIQCKIWNLKYLIFHLHASKNLMAKELRSIIEGKLSNWKK